MTRRLIPLVEVEEQPGYQWAKPRWLQRQVSERRLAYHKVGGRVLIALDDLDKMAEQGRVEVAPGVTSLAGWSRAMPSRARRRSTG